MFNRKKSLAQDHLTAGVLAAFVQLTLPAKQRRLALVHLADCDLCREYLALTAEILGGERRQLGHSRSISVRVCVTAVAAAVFFILFLHPARLALRRSVPMTHMAILASTPQQDFARSDVPLRGPVPARHPSAQPDRGKHAPLASLGSPQRARPDFLASAPAWIELLPATFVEPSRNRIVLKTQLGERWLTVSVRNEVMGTFRP